jgi:chitinase
VTATGKATRYPRSFGVTWRDGLPGLPVVVGLTGELGLLVRMPDEAVSATFQVQRTGATGPTCSVDWRVEGTGSSPVTADYFAGGVLPEGVASFAPTATEFPATFILTAGAAPPSPLTGRVVLFDSEGCRLAPGHSELAFSIAAGVITTEAVVGLDVPFTTLDPEEAPSALARMVYYAGWTSSRLPPAELPLDVTHYIHFSVLPTSSGGLDFTTNELTGGHRTATVAHVHGGGKAILLSVGGAGSITAMRQAANSTNRATFVANLAAAVAADGYDGLDLDWEPLPSSDQTNYRALVTALRAAMPGKLLTTAVPASAESAAVVAGVAAELDYINVMTYDLAGPYPGFVSWHNAALHNGGFTFPSTGEPLPCAELSVAEFLAAGCPKAKLGIGIACYGRRWSGGGVYQPRQSWTTAPTMDDAEVPYHEILVLKATMPDFYDTATEGAWLSTNASTDANDRFIPYDSTATVAAKVAWAEAEGLGSVIAWEADGQYLPGAVAGARHPLLAVMVTV